MKPPLQLLQSTTLVRFLSLLALVQLLVISFVTNFTMSIAVATCNDGVMNGNETDVDCGGSCLFNRKCDDGLRCNSGPDCDSGVCTFRVCQGEYSRW